MLKKAKANFSQWMTALTINDGQNDRDSDFHPCGSEIRNAEIVQVYDFFDVNLPHGQRRYAF